MLKNSQISKKPSAPDLHLSKHSSSSSLRSRRYPFSVRERAATRESLDSPSQPEQSFDELTKVPSDFPKRRARPSNELLVSDNVTRDSLVFSVLESFNQLPEGQGPYPQGTLPYTSSEVYESALGALRSSQKEPKVPTSNQRPPSAVSSTGSDAGIDPPLHSQTQNQTQDIRAPVEQSEQSALRSHTSWLPHKPSKADQGDTSQTSAVNKATAGVKISGQSALRPQAARSASDFAMYNGATVRRVDGQDDISNSNRVPHGKPWDFNPKMQSSSMLSRSRPVPSEYHDFERPSINDYRASLSAPSSPYRQNQPVIMGHGLQGSPLGKENTPPQQSTRNKLLTTTGQANASIDGHSGGSSGLRMSVYPSDLSNTGPEPHSANYPLNSTHPNVNLSQDGRKERPGFFRRVFGTSKNAPTVSKQAPQLPPLDIASDSERKDSKVSRTAIAQPVQPTTQPKVSEQIPREAPAVPEEPRQQLRSKTSFFRRRRKTLTEKDAPPVVPVSTEDASSLPSPSASSLQQVMRPFINNDPTSPADTFYDSREHQPGEEMGQDIGHIDDYETHSPDGRSFPLAGKTRSESVSTAVIPPAAPRTSRALSQPPELDSFEPQPQENGNYRGRGLSAAQDRPYPPRRDSSAALKTASQASDSPSHQRTQRGFNDTDSPISGRSPPSSLRRPTIVEVQSAQSSVGEGFVMSNSEDSQPRNDRIWIQNEETKEEQLERVTTSVHRPIPKRSMSGPVSQASTPNQEFASTVSLQITNEDEEDRGATAVVIDDPSLDQSEPTVSDHEQANRLYHSADDPFFLSKAAVLLGQQGVAGDRLREAYLSLFDFCGINILMALRDFCERFALKGETQQVDRIIASFSKRWCECNPNHGFKAKDVVHTIVYSVFLLNTDLHVANLDQRMTKTQFIRNTLPTVRAVADEEIRGNEETIRFKSSATRPEMPWRDARSPSPASPGRLDRPSIDRSKSESRLSVKVPPRSNSDQWSIPSPTPYDSRPSDMVGPLVNAPSDGSMKAWEITVETVLRDFYNSIRDQPLPLHGASETQLHEQPSNNNLSVRSAGVRRTGSVVSGKAPSDTLSARLDPRYSAQRWQGRNRSRPRLYQSSTLGSSRTSFDDTPLWSPATSSTWSKSYNGRPHPAVSSDSLASHMTQDQAFTQSIGFANALSHAIIREESAPYSDDESANNALLLEDESLELMGAPWAKEGIVHHKHHKDASDKKARERNWVECFAVVEKGWVRLFSFNSKASSRSQRLKARKGVPTVVGGGNWTENAEELESFMLRQTMAHVLPAPGYSKARPFVFALSLPNGAVHLFQVGTPSIAEEFKSTANYWSARLSKEPLVGGVSNVEYGWSESIINATLATAISSSGNSVNDAASRSNTQTPEPLQQQPVPAPPSAARGHGRARSSTHSGSISLPFGSGRPSLQGSLRASIDTRTKDASGLGYAATIRPGDRATLHEWHPPQQSLASSNLSESQQLEALKRYVQKVEDELTTHNELRTPLQLAYSQRGPKYAKAQNNWEEKSKYLLNEIVKFKTYVDALEAGRKRREEIKREAEERRKEDERLDAEAGIR